MFIASSLTVINLTTKTNLAASHQVLNIHGAVYPHHYQFHQIIYREVPGQFNPTGGLGQTLSLSIFTLSLIQAPSFFLCLHNAGSLPLSFLCSLICFFSLRLPSRQTLRQHAAYANHQPFILNTRLQSWMRPQQNTHTHTQVHLKCTNTHSPQCSHSKSLAPFQSIWKLQPDWMSSQLVG